MTNTQLAFPNIGVEPLTEEEQKALQASLRRSKKTKINLKNIPARDEAQTPPYAILPLLPYLPKDWVVWESAASSYGFLGEAIRVLNGNYVIETGLELDGTNYLTAPRKGDIQVTNPPYSIKYEWIERSYDNNQSFAMLMPFDTWAAAKAQAQFQRHGMSIILLNRRVHFHMPNLGWGEFDENDEPIRYQDANGKWKKRESRSDYSVAWFTWGLPLLKVPVTYGYVPLPKELPKWMVRPKNKKEITKGARNIDDRLAIKRAQYPLTWPA